MSKEKKIRVFGMTISIEQIKSMTITVDGRDIHIGEKQSEPRAIGFRQQREDETEEEDEQ